MNSIFARLYNQSAARWFSLYHATHHSCHFIAHQSSCRINKCYHNTSEIIITASISTYSLSFEKLKSLQRSTHSQHELTLPERSSEFEIDSNSYLDSAIDMLSESAVYLYNNHHYMNSRFDDIETRIDKLDTRIEKWFDYVNKRFVKIKNDIKAVKNDVKAVKNDVKAVKNDVKAVKNYVNQRFNKTRAINFNQFAKVLNVEIEKIATSVQDENDQKRYQVSVDFSETVKEFWLLKLNSKSSKLSTRLLKLTSIIVNKLASLARHYFIKNWKNWQCLNQKNSKTTQYDHLEDAIAAHSQQCFWILATKWNLEYEQLKRINDESEKIRSVAQKRKDNDEMKTRRIKLRRESKFETKISFISSKSEEMIIKSKTTKTRSEVMIHHQTTLKKILQQYHSSRQSRMFMKLMKLEYETSSLTWATRLRVHAAMRMNSSVLSEERRISRISKMMNVKFKDSKS